jgi:RNA polymerase sigma-70 factor (ECF subfamily)
MPRNEEQDGSAAAKAADAAVRRGLVESRQELLGFLRRRLDSREEAEEVLQRFSLRALERAADLRDVRTVRGWLGQVLASTIVDHQRRTIRRRRREVDMEQADIESSRWVVN